MTEGNKRFTKYVALPFGGLFALFIMFGPPKPTAPAKSEPIKTVKVRQANSTNATAHGVATYIAYDMKCEKLPVAFSQMANDVIASDAFTTVEFKAATDKVLSDYRDDGPAKWCALHKPVIDKAMRR